MNPRLSAAMTYLMAGCSVVPVRPDGTKNPSVAWKPYTQRKPTLAEIEHWFRWDRIGVGIVAGQVSGNLEILDFDDAGVFEPWCNLVNALLPDMVQQFVVVRTPSGGYHVYYRCERIDGNRKLARQRINGTLDVRIETRGEGGFVVAPGSHLACHSRLREYEHIQGRWDCIPTISVQTRTMLFNGAKAFDETVDVARPTVPRQVMSGHDRPGDRFAATHTWRDILEPFGWVAVRQRGEATDWKRPGKDEQGTSATTGHDGHDTFYVFSSNAEPFEPNRGYGKFKALTLLRFRGDFQAAARAIRQGEV